MKTSDNGRKFIEQWEDLWLVAKDDGYGTVTVGYGHTSAAGPPHVYNGMRITKDEADAILSSDLAAVEANVTHHVTATMTQAQFDAFVSFDFNTGGLDRSSLLRDFNGGHDSLIDRDFLMWVRAGGGVSRGLIRRRQAEIKLFHTGVVQGS